MSSAKVTNHKPYIAKGIWGVIDQLGWMMLSSPKFQLRFPWEREENIDTNFFQLNEGLKTIRRQVGEETYAQLVALSDRMRAHFEADPEDKTEDRLKGRDCIEEMIELLRASRRRKASRAVG